MNNKNFINFHVLISHSPSCLNRDDMNMQKTAVFGGVSRVRISSQSLKRAIRHSDYYQQVFGEPSKRTRELGKLKATLTNVLKEQFSPELIAKTLELVSGKEGIVDETRGDAVAAWSVSEFSALCGIVQQSLNDGLDEKKLEKLILKESESLKKVLAKSMDIALSGRMATSGLMTSIPVDGALAVAHSITTHASEADIDWFTAVDDLVVEAGDVGSGHLDTQEFSAGVFYRYASLNIKQLQANLGNVSREKALEIAAHALHLLATVVPTAKQQSFAAYNLADLVLVSFSDMPISLANAFESPIKKKEGFLNPSIYGLVDYWQTVHQGYGLDERVAAFTLKKAALPATSLTIQSSLPALELWIRQDGMSEA